MAKIKLYVSEGGSLNQGGSGKDSIYSETGAISTSTVQGQEGNDLIFFGNQTTSKTYTAAINPQGIYSAGKKLTAGASAGNAVLSYSGLFVSANKIENAVTSTAIDWVSAGGYTAGLTVNTLQQSGISGIVGSTINGNAGNDSVFLGDQVRSAVNSFIGGGAGNDMVGTYNSGANTAGELNGILSSVTMNGGEGNDTVFVNFSGNSGKDIIINGNKGNDSVTFSSVSAGLNSGLVGGGQGTDTITLDIQGGYKFTVNGGDGADQMTLNMQGAASAGHTYSAGLIQGDTTNTQSGDDTILLTTNAFSNTTIQGFAGNDSIVISAASGGGKNLVAGNAGNDTIYIKSAGVQSGDLSAWTINGGAGNDSIQISAASAGALASSVFNGGQGKDTITLDMANILSAGAAVSKAVTINGGAGADLLTNNAWGSAGGSGSFAWSGYDASTLDAMDTIAFSTASVSAGASFGSARAILRFAQGGLSLSTGTGQSGVSAKSGHIVWSGYTDENLTARVASIDASFTTTGNFAVFTTDGTEKFLFVQGGTTDTVIKLPSVDALSAGGGAALHVDNSSAIGMGD